jgi:hypothetical protein
MKQIIELLKSLSDTVDESEEVYIPENTYGLSEGYHNVKTLVRFLAEMLE